jgi:hypothetical protein
MAEAGAVDDGRRARVDLLRAQIAFASRRGSDAPSLLLRAAGELEPVNPSLAHATYLEALYSTLFVTRLARGVGVLEVSKAVLAGPPPPRQVWKACGVYSPDGGFYDAVNPTTGSVGHRRLVLDQSMIMAALDDALNGDALERYFASDPLSGAARLYCPTSRCRSARAGPAPRASCRGSAERVR